VTPSAGELVAPTLIGDVVTLQPWRAVDQAALAPACGDDVICRFTTVPRRYSPRAAKAWIARQEQRRAAGEAIVLAIRPRAAPPVGTVGLFGLDSPDPHARLGYWLVREWRGRGLGREGVELLARWAFRELAVSALYLDIEPGNVASQRLADVLGARRVGQLQKQFFGAELTLTRFALTQRAMHPLAVSGRLEGGGSPSS
jgi:RimJ/RimL family protein N-acetyltransferase